MKERPKLRFRNLFNMLCLSCRRIKWCVEELVRGRLILVLSSLFSFEGSVPIRRSSLYCGFPCVNAPRLLEGGRIHARERVGNNGDGHQSKKGNVRP